MSSTEIYVIGKNQCELIGETKNAWRGAMYVWNDIAKRYFGWGGFPTFGLVMQSRVWNAHNYHTLTRSERIVLASTMDRVTVKVSDIPQLLLAFNEYGAQHPNSSLTEQAALIAAGSFQDGQYLAWNQTSVNEFYWANGWDDNNCPVYADISDRWDLFEHLDTYHNPESAGF